MRADRMRASTILLKADEGKHIKELLKKGDKYCALGLLGCKAGFGDKIEGATCVYARSIASIYGLTEKCDPPKQERCLCCERTSIYNMIMHLNDLHGLTFKQIGMWLQSVGK